MGSDVTDHTMETLKLEPLAGEDLPAAVASLAASAAPAKHMAARGMAPLRPAETLIAVYQLSFDSDAAVRSAAEAAPAHLPDKIMLGPLGEPLSPSVLHFFAERLPITHRTAIEKILLNHATADETFVHLARRLDEDGLEMIFQNEVRLLRCPALVETLYFNKHARMSSVSRALELCVRNHVRPEGIPGFDELAADLLADPNAAVPSVPDEVFAAAGLLSDAAVPQELGGLAEEEAGEEGLDEDLGGEGQDGEKDKGGSTSIKFDELKIFEKIRLATVGNQYCRQVLIRDTNRVVAMSVVRSPSITDMEIIAAASNRAVCDDVIRYIANSRVHVKDYSVKLALVSNPRCPLGTSLRLLSFLHNDDLKAMSRSRNIPGALSAAAKKLLQTRDQSRGG
jgi:hypothetical protein